MTRCRLPSPMGVAARAERRVKKGAMAGRLAGKVAIVTGAASVGPGVGNGKATAVLFAREGARVVLVNRSEDHARELQREIEAQGGSCSVVVADVTSTDAARRVIDTAVERYGKLDVLFNNVGAGGPGTVVNLSEEVWDRAMQANLRSVMLCCKFAVPRMIESGGGSIINVSTVAAVQGFRRGDVGFAAYSAAKAGVIGLTLAIAADHAEQGIRANCLIVGMVNTPQLAKLGEEHREKRRLAVPLKTEG